MKKIAIVFSFLCVVSAINATVPLKDIMADIEYGIEAGVNVSTIQGVSKQSSISGLMLGGTAKYQFSPNGHIESYLGLIQRGANDDGTKLKLNYLYLPVTLRYALPSSSSLNPFVYTGLYSAYLLSAKYDGDDIDSYVQRHDFGWTYGIGVSVPVNSTLLDVKLGYEMGLRGVYEVSNDWGYNRSLVLKGGLRF